MMYDNSHRYPPTPINRLYDGLIFSGKDFKSVVKSDDHLKMVCNSCILAQYFVLDDIVQTNVPLVLSDIRDDIHEQLVILNDATTEPWFITFDAINDFNNYSIKICVKAKFTNQLDYRDATLILRLKGYMKNIEHQLNVN